MHRGGTHSCHSCLNSALRADRPPSRPPHTRRFIRRAVTARTRGLSGATMMCAAVPLCRAAAHTTHPRSACNSLQGSMGVYWCTGDVIARKT